MIFGNSSTAWYTKSYYAYFHNARQSYYENFYKVVDVDQLLSKMVPDMEHFARTAYPIRILNIPFDSTPARLTKLLGTPKSKKTETDRSEVMRTTLFYKRPFFGTKAIFQFNFLNDMYTSCIVTFMQHKDPEEQVFLRIIREKYLSPDDKVMAAPDGITDEEGNLIIYEKSVYPCLVYVNAQAVDNNLQREFDEKRKMRQLADWNKHYQHWRQNL